MLQDALRDPGLRVGYLVPGAGTFVDSTGGELAIVGEAVVSAGHTIGTIVSRGPANAALVAEVGRRAALLVEMVRLRLEVRASRARLQLAGYEERKRVERDLHDGAQQRLVALGMRLRYAQRDSGTDVDELIDGAVGELARAVEDLRAIAQGLRPSGLDDGLAAALAGLSEGYPIPLTIEVADLDETPEGVALTAYFVACEALTNAAKHSRARKVGVQVSRTGKNLWLRVRDDGCGGASPSGSGLAGLRDRVAASGGTLRLNSTDSGTTVEAVLPCA